MQALPSAALSITFQLTAAVEAGWRPVSAARLLLGCGRPVESRHSSSSCHQFSHTNYFYLLGHSDSFFSFAPSRSQHTLASMTNWACFLPNNYTDWLTYFCFLSIAGIELGNKLFYRSYPICSHSSKMGKGLNIARHVIIKARNAAQVYSFLYT